VSDELRTIAQAVMSAYGQHDVTALGALYAADAALVFPGATFNGREEIIRMWPDSSITSATTSTRRH